MDLLLEVKDLRTSFFTYAGEVRAVDGVSFHLEKGEAIGIVGESGCGKSVTALSVMRLLSDTGKIMSGAVTFDGEDMLGKTEEEMEHVRGNKISMVFQDPMTSLNPVLRIGLQMSEVLRLHQGMTRKQALAKAAEMLDLVGIPNPRQRLAQYPHQFSGGMRQRVMIATALSCNPQLLIADEPTTALDVTVQAQILDLMRGLKDRLRTSIILITHDLGVVAGMASRVLVMYAGKIIEEGPVKSIYSRPKHPYTWGLLGSIPRLNAKDKRRLVPIHGQPPDLIEPPPGCRFNPRCGHALRICLSQEPPLNEIGSAHQVACWRYHPQAPPLVLEAQEGRSAS
jgi:oligopeptide transport system ATP-binding protein